MSMILDGSNGVTFNDSSLQGAAASPYGLKNRIINGDMRIDQRNAGASVTAGSGSAYTVDRWAYAADAASKFSIQQSSTAPSGFSYSVLLTSLSAYTPTSSQAFQFRQSLEGYNMADWAWGTASAKTITLSFWVRSSLTGNFGGSIVNDSENRCYAFSYTINSANTWEQKSVTIAGPTDGTWGSTNGTGLRLVFSVGMGSTFSGTANTWNTSTIFQPTGSTNLVSTNGATLYITGVQLEIGSTATPFERRLYGQELQLCQRYYSQSYDIGTVAGTATGTSCVAYVCMNNSTTSIANNGVGFRYITTMRATPTLTTYSPSGASGKIQVSKVSTAAGDYTSAQSNVGTNGAIVYGTGVTGLTAGYATEIAFQYTVSAEL